MKAAAGLTAKFVFSMLVAYARQRGVRYRMPPADRLKAIEALLQAICFHYDPLANRVNASITTIAIECGLATEAKTVSISRASRALQFLELLGLITYKTEYCGTLGCYFPSDITFKSEFFRVLDISERAVEGACRSRASWKNKQRTARGLPALAIEEMVKEAWGAVRKRFYDKRIKLKRQGEKRAQAKRDAERSRKDIEALVRRQLNKEIIAGTFPADLNVVLAEIATRVKQRMFMSRGSHTRIAAT